MDETSTPDSSALLDQLLRMFAGNLQNPSGQAGSPSGPSTQMDRSQPQFAPARALSGMQDMASQNPMFGQIAQLLEALNPIDWMGGFGGAAAGAGAAGRGGFKLANPASGGRAGGVINPTVRGNQMPSDPWSSQRQGMSRPPMQQPAQGATNMQSPNAGLIDLPRNPHDVPWTQQQQMEYNKLPQGGRSQQVPEDARRRGMGETSQGPQMPQPPRQQSGGMPPADNYRMFQELARALGIQIQ